MVEDNTRELFLNIMHYREFDRMPVMHWTGWPETLKNWYEQGLPEDVSQHEYFNASPLGRDVSVNLSLYPPFDEEVIEETEEYRIFRQGDGVIAKDWKHKSSIPHFIDFTLTDGSQWDEYKKRLQLDPARIPDNLDKRIEKARAGNTLIRTHTGSMVGWIRNWMGVNNMSYLAFDDRELFKEMVNTITDLVIWGLDQICDRITPDIGWGWEDICFRTGPLVSPDIFEDVAVPGYQRIAEKLHSYGIDLYLVDCDGFIDDLVPHWLEGGVNVMFPLEIGAWEKDPADLKNRFGRELRIFGGIDKLEIAKGPEAIDAEINRRVPLMKEGGYVPLPDHLIIPDTSLDDYRYYLDRIRELRV